MADDTQTKELAGANVVGSSPTSFPWSAAAGALGAVGNVVSTWLTNRANERMNERNNQLQQQLAQQANQWNIEQWNRENAYNLPTAQLQRMRDAGLNPSLAMTGGDLMNEAAASPQATMANTRAMQNIAPQVDPLTLAQIADLSASADEKRSRIPLNSQQANLLREQADKTFKETEQLGLANDFLSLTKDARIAACISSSNLEKSQADEALNYVKDTAKKNYDTLCEQLDILKKQKAITGEEYNQAMEKTRELKAIADITEYNDKMKEATWWIDTISKGITAVGDIADMFNPLSKAAKAIKAALKALKK